MEFLQPLRKELIYDPVSVEFVRNLIQLCPSLIFLDLFAPHLQHISYNFLVLLASDQVVQLFLPQGLLGLPPEPPKDLFHKSDSPNLIRPLKVPLHQLLTHSGLPEVFKHFFQKSTFGFFSELFHHLHTSLKASKCIFL